MPLDLANMNLEERAKYLELKERYKKKLLPWYKRWWGVVILVILALVLLLAAISSFYILDKVKEIKTETTSTQTVDMTAAAKSAVNGIGTNYSLGPKDAPLTIIEFSDFACPFCQKAHGILKDINKKYPKQVRIVFRDMPLHSNSTELALAARCVGEQGKFWEIHDLLFENQTSLTATGAELTTLLESLVGTLGINQEAYIKCYSDKKYLSDIGTDFGDGTALQLVGTPTWFLNYKRISGYIPEEDFLAIVEGLLNTK
ncbi:MAG: thioredoxin domain-containing protein [Patescibacteria group bacterium]